jgi:hexosaminidase
MKSIAATRTRVPVPLDGDAAKWQSAPSVSFEGRPLGGCPRRAAVYAMWDGEDLYLRFDVRSSKLQASVREHDGDKLWYDDGIEFLIDAQRQRTEAYLPDDFAYHINILNAVFDDRGTPDGKLDGSWNGVARHSVTILDDYRYVVEVAVPWDEIGVEPRAGETVIGIDFCVNGKDPDTGQYDYFDWCGLKRFHDPSGFGDLLLVDHGDTHA